LCSNSRSIDKLQADVKLAASTGDLSSLLKLLIKTTKLSVDDYIKATCGSFLYLYYGFCDRFHCVPVDLMDLRDGMLYIMASNYQHKEM